MKYRVSYDVIKVLTIEVEALNVEQAVDKADLALADGARLAFSVSETAPEFSDVWPIRENGQ